MPPSAESHGPRKRTEDEAEPQRTRSRGGTQGNPATKSKGRERVGDQGRCLGCRLTDVGQGGLKKETVAKHVHGAKGRGGCREDPGGPVSERMHRRPVLQTWYLLFPVHARVALGPAPTLSSGICSLIWPLSAPQMVFLRGDSLVNGRKL